MSCGREYGSGVNSAASTVVNSVVAAPMPSASVATAARKNDGWRTRLRAAADSIAAL